MQRQAKDLAAARRDRRLEELKQLFLREGFLHFGTEELARRLQCSKRALYQIAPSRGELFEEAVEKWLAELRQSGNEAAARAPDPLTAVTDYLGAAITATRDASAQFVRDLSRYPATYRRLMRHQRERIAGLEQLIERGTARGHFRGVHPKLVAEVMLNAVAQLVDPEVLARVGLTMSEGFAEFYDIVEHGLLPQNARRARASRNGRSRPRRAARR
jgi:AcrR family transcriptional regulator